KIRSGIWIDTFVQLFVNHTHRGGVATGKTFHEFDAVVPVGADRDGMMHFFPITRVPDSERRAQIFHQLESARHRATKRPANSNMRFAGRLLAKHWIKSNQFENVDRL